MKPLFPIDKAREHSASLKDAGFRVRIFQRAGNPLDWDSGVRPTRYPGMCEMLARIEGSPNWRSAWVWVECRENEIMRVHELANNLHFSTVGFPRS